MKYKIVKLKKENELNRELRKQKKERGEIAILFVSPWDKYSVNLMEQLERENKNPPAYAKTLYIVDSYNMPHSFVIFNSTVLPQLVRINKNKVLREDYLPMVYNTLGLE
jgi:hypothetical protein